MKMNINYELSTAEKKVLKEQNVSLKSLQKYAPDEVAAMLDASPCRAKELQALAEFQSIPSLGIGFAKELMRQGYYSLEDLRGKSGVKLFDAFEKHCGCWADPCVEDSYRLLAHFIEHRDESKRWWNFTNDRKAYRSQYGYPADRPGTAWYQTGLYPKMKTFKQDK